MSTRRLAVVSYAAHDPFSPRATRTRATIACLERDWSIELFASNTPLRTAPQSRLAVRVVRSMLRRAAERAVLDKHELWSRREFVRWVPDVCAALLIGLPVSPLIYAAARLRMHEIPYVVDLGDPWVLTHPDPAHKWPGSLRAARAERLLWEGAAGGIVTTSAVSRMLRAEFPTIPILVRPNGYEVTQPPALDHIANHPGPANELRLVHFGGLGPARVDVGAVLRQLATNGRWKRVSFAQYGSDWSEVLSAVGAGVEVTRHEPVPWQQALAIAREADAAIVVGNHSSYQMPSKVVQYLTVPIPRIALTNGRDDDALTQYVAGKPGWLTLGQDDLHAADRVACHLSRRWTPSDLAPPESEAWPRVATQLCSFVNRAVASSREEP